MHERELFGGRVGAGSLEDEPVMRAGPGADGETETRADAHCFQGGGGERIHRQQLGGVSEPGGSSWGGGRPS